jgi:hypothetical protein
LKNLKKEDKRALSLEERKKEKRTTASEKPLTIRFHALPHKEEDTVELLRTRQKNMFDNI